MIRIVRILAFGIFVIHVFASLRVVAPDSYSNASIRVWPLKYDGNTVHFSPIYGQLVEESYQNKTDKIVVLRKCNKPYEPKYRSLQNQGVIAIICAVLGAPRDMPGNEMYAIDGSNTDDINVPIVTVVRSDIEHIHTTQEVFITIETEPNNFMELFESWWLTGWQVSLVVVGLANACFSVYRIYGLVTFYNGCKRTVGLCCMVLCLSATLGMVFVFAIDPFGCRRILPFWFRGIIETLPLPIVIAPLFLMGLWCHSMLQSLKFQVHPGLPRFRWIFYTWVTFLIVQELTLSIMAIFWRLPTPVLAISPTLYVIGFAVVLIFCCITLYRLKRRVKKLQAKSTETRAQLNRLRIQFVSIIITIIIVYLLYTTYMFGATLTPVGWITWFWFFWLTMNALITIQLVALRPPIKSKGDSSKRTSASKPTIVDTHMTTRYNRDKNDMKRIEDLSEAATSSIILTAERSTV